MCRSRSLLPVPNGACRRSTTLRRRGRRRSASSTTTPRRGRARTTASTGDCARAITVCSRSRSSTGIATRARGTRACQACTASARRSTATTSRPSAAVRRRARRIIGASMRWGNSRSRHRAAAEARSGLRSGQASRTVADENVNPMPIFAAAGATCQGPFRERPNDVASVGWYYGRLSDRIQPPATYPQALELNYQYAISTAVNVVIDAQYLFRLNGYPSRGTTVLGTQLAVTFQLNRKRPAVMEWRGSLFRLRTSALLRADPAGGRNKPPAIAANTYFILTSSLQIRDRSPIDLRSSSSSSPSDACNSRLDRFARSTQRFLPPIVDVGNYTLVQIDYGTIKVS